MRTRSKLATLALSSGVAIASFAGIAGPAHAADTTTTFAVTAGSISIAVPTSAAFGSVSTGTLTVTGPLGPVTVADTRGALVNSWATTVTNSAFVTGGSTPAETVVATNVAYVSGASTAHSGLGVFVPGTKALPPTYAGAAGNSSTTWNPTVTFILQASQVAGTYTGTVTHSLA